MPLTCNGGAETLRNQYGEVQANRIRFVTEGFTALEVFKDEQELSGFSVADVGDYLRRPVEDRVGLMGSIEDFTLDGLGLADNVDPEDREAVERREALLKVISGLKEPFSHPLYLSEVNSGFIDTALTYPKSQTVEQDLEILHRAAGDIERVSAMARSALPLMTELYRMGAFVGASGVRTGELLGLAVALSEPPRTPRRA